VRLTAIWGKVSLAALAFWRDWRWNTLLAIAGAWIVITLLPYSFLTYMPYVPSRHTYFASVGLALVIGVSLLTFAERVRQRSWAIWMVATLLVFQNCAYLWTRKHRQFVERAAPTERLIQFAGKSNDTVYVRCFPYARDVARLAIEMRLHPSVRPALVFSASEGSAADAIDLCGSGSEQR
jgi:hypothetical protein